MGRRGRAGPTETHGETVTRDQVRTALTDRQAVIATLYGEIRGGDVAAVAAVSSVIANRVRKKAWWGSGWKGVCLHKWQFSCWWETSKNADMTYAFAESLLLGTASGCATLEAIADLVMAGLVVDQTRGSCHYVTAEMLAKTPPTWASGRSPAAEIGGHVFFRGVA